MKITVSRSLIIPLRDANGKIWTLEYITEQGKKFMMKSGLKKGRFYMFGKPAKRLFLCEGYATAESVYSVVKECTVCCVDAGNLKEVASDVLPSPLKEFAASLSANLETPESAAVLCCLSVLTTAVQGKFDVAVSKDYHEPLNLYVMVAMPPANRKSSILRQCLAPLRQRIF